MKRYRFSLESVLEVRRTQEEQARQRLAAANHHLHRTEAAFLAETERYRARVEPSGPCDLDSFRVSRLRSEQAAECVELAHQRLEAALVTATARQVQWSDAAQQVAALERLDERRRSEWWTEFRRQEELEVNDMVTSRWASRSVGAHT